MGDDNMKLHWEKDDRTCVNRYIAETAQYRFVMIAPRGKKPELWVQRAGDEWGTKPIDQRTCRSRRHAEIIAQRFEDKQMARRLR